MMLTILRTGFLAYVRVLLCLQGLGLGFWAFAWWPVRETSAKFWAPLGLALLFAILGLAWIVTAIMLRRGRRLAAIAAILMEALWAALAAALWYKTLEHWPFDWHLLGVLTAGAALFLVAVGGLLLRPVRAYSGLIRADRPRWTAPLGPAGNQ